MILRRRSSRSKSRCSDFEPLTLCGVGGRVCLERRDLLGYRIKFVLLGPPQCNAAAVAMAHGASDIDIGGRACDGKAGPARLEGTHLLEAELHKVRKLEVLEEEVKHFLARQYEAEIVFGLTARRRSLARTASAEDRLWNAIPGAEFTIAGKNVFLAPTAGRVLETRLARAFCRNGNDVFGIDVGDLAAFDLFVDGPLQFRARTPEKALTVAQAFVLGIETAIDEIRH